MMPRTATGMFQNNIGIAGIVLFCAALLIGCDQWSTGYLRNASNDTVTVRLRRPEFERIGDSAGLPVYRKRFKWGVVRLGPRQSFQIGRHMGPTFRESIYDSVEASGPGFSLKLSGETILLLPMAEKGYNYYYQLGWRPEEDE
jgi:hypothetical protein